MRLKFIDKAGARRAADAVVGGVRGGEFELPFALTRPPRNACWFAVWWACLKKPNSAGFASTFGSRTVGTHVLAGPTKWLRRAFRRVAHSSLKRIFWACHAPGIVGGQLVVSASHKVGPTRAVGRFPDAEGFLVAALAQVGTHGARQARPALY